MRLKKKIFGIILSFALVLGLMPGMSMTTYAEVPPKVTISPEGGGTTSFNTTGSGSWVMYYFTATPAEGYHFVKWTYPRLQDGGQGSSSSNPWILPADNFTKGYYGDVTAVFEQNIVVSNISLDQSAISLSVGGTQTLTSTISPDNATYKTVIWTSDDESVATVSNGVVTAVAEGSATITATATNGTDDTSDDKTATCAVTVAPITYTVTYKVANGAWSDGSSADKTEIVKSGANPANVPTGMIAASGYTGGSWDKNPSSAVISGNTTFTYTFVAASSFDEESSDSTKVPYDDVAISTGSVNDITGTASATAESNPFETKIENNDNLTSLLSLTDAEVAQGVNVWLDIQDMSATVPQAEKNIVQNASTNLTVGMYLDISLFKKVGGNTATKITETNGTVKASILIPESLWKTGRTFEIIRVHDGVPTVISGTYDENTHVFTFETDRFSTYALAYKDPASLSDSGTNSNSGSSNSSNNTQSTSPKTGDPNDIRVWYLLLIASLGGLGFLVFSKKKKVND